MKGLRCNQVHSFEGHAPRNPDGLNNQPAASSRRNPSPGQLLRVLHNETSPSVMVQSTLSVHKRAQAARPRLRPVMQSLAQIADPGQDPGCNYGSWEFRPKLQAGQMRHNRIAHQNSDIQPDIQRNSIPYNRLSHWLSTLTTCSEWLTTQVALRSQRSLPGLFGLATARYVKVNAASSLKSKCLPVDIEVYAAAVQY